MRRVLFLAVLFTSCVAAPPPQVPARLQVCPDPVHAPPAPPAPRTVTALLDWAKANELARERTEAARRDCAGRLADLNLWILQHRP